MKREEKNSMASPRPRTIMSLITWEKSLMPVIQWWLSQLSFNRREHKSEEMQILVILIYDKMLYCPLSFHKSAVWKYVFMKGMLMLNAVQLTSLKTEEKKKKTQMFQITIITCILKCYFTFVFTQKSQTVYTQSNQFFEPTNNNTFSTTLLALSLKNKLGASKGKLNPFNIIFSLSFDCFKHLAFPNLLALKLNIPNKLNIYFLTLKYL